jgi:hypothetical protein
VTAMVQRSFAGGEISSSLQARADLTRYQTGLRISENGTIKSDGGWQNRPGTVVVAETKNSGATRLIEWEYNDDDLTYVLELGDFYMRFHRGGVPVTVDTADAWSSLTNYLAGDIVVVAGVAYVCILANTNHTPANATYWYALTDNILEIPTPWAVADLAALKYIQDASLMKFTHKDYEIYDLTRRSHTAWALTPVAAPNNSWGVPRIATPTNITFSHSTGTPVNLGAGNGVFYPITAVSADGEESFGQNPAKGLTAPATSSDPMGIAWDAVSGARGYNVYRLDSNGLGFLGFTTNTAFTDYGTFVQDTTETPPEQRLEFFNTHGFYPSAACFYQQRLILANFKNYDGAVTGVPANFIQGIYASIIGQYHNFVRKFPILVTNSLRFELKSEKVQGVKHLLNFGKLLVFTDSGEWVMRGDANGILRAGEENPDQLSANGASDIPPLKVNTNVLYVQKQGNIVREIGYEQLSGGRDGYKNADLTAMAKHLFKGRTIVSWAYQKTPHSIIWIVFDDGEMAGVTYVKGRGDPRLPPPQYRWDH